MHLADGVKITEQARERMNALWPDAGSEIADEVRQEYPSDIIIGPREGSGGPWENARDEAEARGLVKRGSIGQADCMLFKAKDVIVRVEEIRRNGPFSVSSSRRDDEGEVIESKVHDLVVP